MDAGMGPICKKKQAIEDAEAEFEKIQIKIDEVMDMTEVEVYGA